MKENAKFDNINGLRAIAAIGIILIHIEANTNYNISSPLYTVLVPELATFVFMFMLLSAFCLCCGYYNKIKKNEITLNEFYKKRYARIFPFFALLVLLEVIYQHNLPAIYEGFIDLTLAFPFLPNPEITVMGIGWTLGIIFSFYMLFPFFVFLFDNKKRGFLTFIVSILITFACINYFFSPYFVTESFTFKHNFMFCFMFFAAGGEIFLNKESIMKFTGKINKWISLLFCIALTIVFLMFVAKAENYRIFYICLLFSFYLIYAISYKSAILNNKIMSFLSKYSMEMYLSHMLVFRVVEKLGILYLFKNAVLNYTFVSIIVVALSLVIAILFRYVYDKFALRRRGKLNEQAI